MVWYGSPIVEWHSCYKFQALQKSVKFSFTVCFSASIWGKVGCHCSIKVDASPVNCSRGWGIILLPLPMLDHGPGIIPLSNKYTVIDGWVDCWMFHKQELQQKSSSQRPRALTPSLEITSSYWNLKTMYSQHVWQANLRMPPMNVVASLLIYAIPTRLARWSAECF